MLILVSLVALYSFIGDRDLGVILYLIKFILQLLLSQACKSNLEKKLFKRISITIFVAVIPFVSFEYINNKSKHQNENLNIK